MRNTITYFSLWLPMIFIAVINGAARDLLYKNYVGELTAHQISTVTLIIALWIYIQFIIKKYTPRSEKKALFIGIFWMALTVIFEFGLGIARGHSLSQLFNNYNILKGRIWVLIPIWITIAPYLAYRINKSDTEHTNHS